MSTSPSLRRARRHGTTATPSRAPRVAAVTLLAAVLFVGTSLAAVYQDFSGRLERQSSDISDLLGTARPTSKDEEVRNPTDSWEGQALNILVLGSDDRAGANQEWGEFEGMRSDTAMIVHVAADRSRIDVVSIPRDLIVEIPPCPLPNGSFSYQRPLGTNEHNGTRFNAAFSIGSGGTDVRHGAACAILTVENMTDIYIDDWAVVDMDGFRTMVDAIGGVDMCFEEAIDNKKADLKIEAGCQTLTGQQALGFARARKGIGDGSDISRIERQQELMGAMADQVLSAGVLANPSKLLPFLSSAAASVHTSERLGNLNNLAGLGYSVRNLQGADINFLTPPLGYTGPVVLQTFEMGQVWEDLREDRPLAAADEGEDDAPLEEESENAGGATSSLGAGESRIAPQTAQR